MKKIKLKTIVGARPQFIKAAMLSKAIEAHRAQKNSPEICESIVHTGQHYDQMMSEIFFQELTMPEPEYHLNIGSGAHSEQTGAMLIALEKILLNDRPDVVLVYGDTNSTLAGALAAAKLHLPIVHVEAGLRSYNRNMPEELNRILTDRISDLLLCPNEVSYKNLEQEGLSQKAQVVGDIMADSLFYALDKVPKKMDSYPDNYCLITFHRAENTHPNEVLEILKAMETISKTIPVIFPIHPRTETLLKEMHWQPNSNNLKVIPPVGYYEMLGLQKNAQMIFTDSGGIQKEAYLLGIPCITLRTETEWTETISTGWNTLCPIKEEAIVSCFENKRQFDRSSNRPLLFGDGLAREKILSQIITLMERKL